MSTAVVIGKFLPFHLGHRHLMDAADVGSDDLAVIVCDASWHKIPAATRVAWIRESFPSARVEVIDQDRVGLDDSDSPGWAAATIEVLGAPPELVFTSEDYGPAYAKAMGAEHAMVDRERTRVPISATAVRADPGAHLQFLEPHVRAHYVKRVCLVGAESSGKTTLAGDLAEHYGVPFVPEFGRHFTEAMPDPTRHTWTTEDLRLIARAQVRFEDDAAGWVGPLLICDTDVLVTSVFHEALLGSGDPELTALAASRRPQLYVLCGLDVPFVQDNTGTREDGHRREWMHGRYVELLERGPAPWMQVTGTRDERLQTATARIDELAGA